MRAWARLSLLLFLLLPLLAAGAPALACGGLVAPGGTINLVRTTTLAGYRDGVEHYVTAFEFAGGGGEFGSIVPLPGMPAEVVRGGDWTLQRLVREVRPPIPLPFLAASESRSADAAQVLLEKRIDALDITILKGGGDAVGEWAREHGFDLSPDAPEVLDFYAARSPIFMAARFDAEAARARGQGIGDATPIHLVIPTERPWVPLRILALGRQGIEPVEADVFLLTPREPSLLPEPLPPDGSLGDEGLFLERSAPASKSLLADLRSDRRMKWIPRSGVMWLTYLRLRTKASDLRYDLAVGGSGGGPPSPADAGLAPAGRSVGAHTTAGGAAWALVALCSLLALALVGRRAAKRTA